MEYDPPCFTVNVSGRRFELNLDTVQRIPYIHARMKDCATGESEIYVARSPMLFEHVLALAYDSQYRCPAECRRELEFYAMENQCEIQECMQKIEAKFSNLDTAIFNFQMEERTWRCGSNGCVKYTRKGKTRCPDHLDICNKCDAKTRNNYCEAHVDSGAYCNKGKCKGIRGSDGRYCPYHYFCCQIKM